MALNQSELHRSLQRIDTQPGIRKASKLVADGIADGDTAAIASAVSTVQTGVTDGSNAAAGKVGEYIESVISAGSATSLTNGVNKNVTSITLTPGDWDVWGAVYFSFAASTITTRLAGGTSSVSATIFFPSSFTNKYAAGFVPVDDMGFATPLQRYSLTSNQTTYIVAFANFTTAACSAYGYIAARRIR